MRPQSRSNRGLLAGLALISLLGTSHPLAVPGIHAPRPSNTTCEIKPSPLWLQPQAPDGPPQQTVQVQMDVVAARSAGAGQAAVLDTSAIHASVNGTTARVDHAEWLTVGVLSLLVVVPQSPQVPVPYTVQVSVAGSQCNQRVEVPAVPQWTVYVPACEDLSLGLSESRINGMDSEAVLQSLLPLASSNRTSVWLPDAWGAVANTWGMVSVLAHAGITGLARNMAPALAVNPGLFWWEGPDGARVLTYVPVNEVAAQSATQPAQSSDLLVRLITDMAGRYATFKQTGHYPADAFLLDCAGLDSGGLSGEVIDQWNRRYAYPHIAGGQDAFFADMAARYGPELATVRGGMATQWDAGLVEDVAGTQQARARAVEQLGAQTLAAIASTPGYSPTEVGPTAAPVSEPIAAFSVLARQISTGSASAGPASAVITDSAEPDPYVAVFNPLAWVRSAPVTVTVAGDAPVYLTDVSTGNTLYSQRIAPHTLMFIAPDVPALGYKVFRLEGPQPDAASVQAEAFATSNDAATGAPILGSSRFTLTADLATGGVAVSDTLLGRSWLSGTLDGRAIAGNQLLYSVDGALLRPSNLAARVTLSGPVAAQLQITGQFTQGSITSFTQTATLFNGLGYVQFENAISTAERATCPAAGCPVERLYFAYPIDLVNAPGVSMSSMPSMPLTQSTVLEPEMRVDTIGGLINPRTDLLPGVRRDDYAVQSFASVSAGELGATVALPDIAFVEFGGLRTQQGFRTQPASSQVFALAWATGPTSQQPQPADIQYWRLGWMPYVTAFDPAASAATSVRFGWEQRAPLLIRRLPANQPGPLPGTSRSYGPLLSGTGDSAVVVSALKPAHDGAGLVLRLWNPGAVSQTVSLDLGALGVQQLQLADGLERPIAGAEPALSTRPLTVTAHSFLTLRLLREAPAGEPVSRVESTSPLPTPTGLSATVVVASPTALPTTTPTVAPTSLPTALGQPLPTNSAPVALPTATPSPPATDTPTVAATAIATTASVPVSATSALPATSAAATPIAVASPTVVTVNAGGTPTTQVTPAGPAPVAPPVVPATAIPIATPLVTATATVGPGATAAVSTPTQPLVSVTPTGTGAAASPTATATPTNTTPNSRQLSVLDAFDRADGAVGADWRGQSNRFAIKNNRLIQGASGSYNVMYWLTPTAGTAQEVAITFGAINLDMDSPDVENSEISLMLQWQGQIARPDSLRCYAVSVTYEFVENRVTVRYCDSGLFDSAPTAPGGVISNIKFVAGDVFSARIDSETKSVQVFKNGALIGTANVSNWDYVESNGGRMGLWYKDIGGVELDNFAGQ